ncbi:hypothetical protein MYCTH_2128401 [Thermothelomyces thermophilus ATCC 42464]|uniref:TMEM205-like domain-containing protein n=1 Tax=Thermothelomyces thermophilus (strain ATCC 42464 / BCRC 31852 / DSM 1799) TaxID=573729 RepID=G2QG87_THET4|nr:uncharacterized protein MYCTH_2128401 [Thermothelomyces thermophilus ATCC 42464]AEO59347.1 hypothetical protein MYCTH_2128401 [Thermothelomyces thermophilus ATCC 42464]
MALHGVVSNLVSTFFINLAPFHLLFYSALLGTELFQTFVNTKVCFVALPRSAFTTLQKRLFPVYFGTQTALVVLSALTFPPHGLSSLILRKGNWIPYAVAFGTALLNLVVYGPRTRRAMVNCIHQETRDTLHAGEESRVDREPSPDMQRLRKSFSRHHAMAIHINLISIGAMVFHGWRLGSKLAIGVE